MRFSRLSLIALLTASVNPLVWPLTARAEAATEATATPEKSAEVLPAITVSTVSTRELTDIVLASGLISAVEEVQVAPLIEGQQIEAVLVDVGDKVTAGQVLARLSPSSLELQQSQLEAQVASAKAQVAQAEASLVEAQSTADEANRVNERAKALRAQGTASQAAADQAAAAATSANAGVLVARQQLESAKANQTLAEAQRSNIELQLARAEVKAPVSGEITARNAKIGAIASAAGDPMFTIIRDGALELRADVAERDVMRLQPGQTATLTLSGSAEGLVGTVRLVEPVIDPLSRLGRARIGLPVGSAVRSGMFAEASIVIARRSVVAVPVTAVGSAEGETTVMRVRDGAVDRVKITTGIRDAGWVEVLTGLASGDTIVTKAGAFVRPGDRINPIPADAGTN
ncbi:efflux RND transporter periplasmic adaptor subunit [Fuscibacter oryzae]|uniref:Efflux RND transporter periplasmic adaptor subunit n=1 Tax=Fuscibacter oryzae TaxID=2803939 RepID=A0A8J7MMI5_9RHOB|nr:efflux RND transporter periplasmic adaptor subunit [Fuscibacter oryzae]MBL4927570.1 efflux RND transporter periplasmic adaptor subunit [Fuscibacter oryzae]